MAEHFDVIITGPGAGGGTLVHALAGSGKRILLLERGDLLPRETGNWDPKTVFVEGNTFPRTPGMGPRTGQPPRRGHQLLPQHRRGEPALTAMANALRLADHISDRIAS